jgi:hypothetical protein
MITPKEKAIELVDKFYNYVNPWDDNGNANYKQAEINSKQCALLLVDEIIEFGNQQGIREPMMYWQSVKQEINKL